MRSLAAVWHHVLRLRLHLADCRTPNKLVTQIVCSYFSLVLVDVSYCCCSSLTTIVDYLLVQIGYTCAGGLDATIETDTGASVLLW